MLTEGRGEGKGAQLSAPPHTHRSWRLLEPRRPRFSRVPRGGEPRPPGPVRRGPDLDLGSTPEAPPPMPMGSEFLKFSAQSFEPRHPRYPAQAPE